MRPQITAYLHADTKAWLTKYAAQLGLQKSEVVRFLLEREAKVRWLKWARSVPDPAQGRSATLKQPKGRFRWRDPPKPSLREGRRSSKPAG
jgi:antitoxin component of RelBE/YafQ-DinJ toxin-antitoxin module